MAEPKAPRKQKVYLICNAHLDPVWLWQWEEGAAAAISTFRTAADLCEADDTYIFNHNEAILYQWVEEFEPDLFARIQRLVTAGRWHIMGGWYLQPDCNMPSGESFVRQIMLGRRYFAEKFGAQPATAINFDPFGHTQGLPQILARSGYHSYIFCRPGEVDCHLPDGPFLWEGYDGSRVMAVRPWGHYLSALGKASEKVEQYLDSGSCLDPGILLWGVGDHGGGPSRQDLADLADLIDAEPEIALCHAAPEDYFREVSRRAGSLPIHNQDLNPWAVGCYSSMMMAKYKHRLLENELYATEKMVTAAWANQLLAYPQEELREASQDLATAEFHDILPGSAIQPVEEMALRQMDHGLEILSRVKARAFFALAKGQPAAAPGEIPVLVYNPHPYPVTANLECEFQLADQNWGSDFTIATAYQGEKALPSQIEQEASSLNLDWRKRLVFQARLEPGQMNRFDCRLDKLAERPAPVQPEGESIHFNNGSLDVMISKRTGLLESCAWNGVEYLRSGGARLVVMADTPDPWGMRVRSFTKRIGAFRLLTPQRSAWLAAVPAPSLSPVRVIEDGPVRTVVEALFGFRHSYAVMHYKLPKQGGELEVDVRVHWNEKDALLKLSLPLARVISGRKASYRGQVAYGVAQLPHNGDEAVAQKWVAVAGSGQALTVINDRTYASSCTSRELLLTLLRSPAYSAHPIHDRPILPVDRYSPRIDQGERLFRFCLQGGQAQERLERVDREALAYNEAPMVLSFFPSGDGTLPNQFARLEDQVIQVTAIKKAEDGDNIIVRLFNPTAHARCTTISLPFAHASRQVNLGKYEIKTLRFDRLSHNWDEVNLMETEVE